MRPQAVRAVRGEPHGATLASYCTVARRAQAWWTCLNCNLTYPDELNVAGLLAGWQLRDLKTCVFDHDGRGDEGTRRLKVVLREMKGPASELTKLLGACSFLALGFVKGQQQQQANAGNATIACGIWYGQVVTSTLKRSYAPDLMKGELYVFRGSTSPWQHASGKGSQWIRASGAVALCSDSSDHAKNSNLDRSSCAFL
jgi:hypothetical protein